MDVIFEMLAYNTNMNAAVKKPPDAVDPNDRFATSDGHWTKTNALEMRAFVGINIPKDYWSNDSALNDSYISSIMS